jgi:tRNA (cytidine32/uridine32-2'-O)-methyltransferase
VSTPDPLDRFVVVLNRTQDVVNIATALRAMLNMGFTRLRLVAPDDFNAYRIAGIAHGTESIIENIEFYDTLPAALADTSFAVGTTARRRTASYVWQYTRAAAPLLCERSATPDRPIAIIFGREDTGLLNHELDLCDLLLVAPTNPEFSSLNLSQAVLLVCYELWLAGGSPGDVLPQPKRKAEMAEWQEMQRMFGDVERALHTIEFFKSRNEHMIMRSLRALIRRAEPNEREVKLLRAVAIEIWKYFDRLRAQWGPGPS